MKMKAYKDAGIENKLEGSQAEQLLRAYGPPFASFFVFSYFTNNIYSQKVADGSWPPLPDWVPFAKAASSFFNN